MLWQAPECEGNSPITRYIVEKADAEVNERTFITAGETTRDTLKLKVDQFDTGKHYMVQVFAENEYGKGKPACGSVHTCLPSGESVIHLFFILCACALNNNSILPGSCAPCLLSYARTKQDTMMLVTWQSIIVYYNWIALTSGVRSADCTVTITDK